MVHLTSDLPAHQVCTSFRLHLSAMLSDLQTSEGPWEPCMQCPASQPTDLGVGWDREQQQSWNWSLISLPGGAVHSHDLTRVTCLSNEGVEVRKGVPATGNSVGRGTGLESV